MADPRETAEEYVARVLATNPPHRRSGITGTELLWRLIVGIGAVYAWLKGPHP